MKIYVRKLKLRKWARVTLSLAIFAILIVCFTNFYAERITELETTGNTTNLSVEVR